MDFHWVCLTVLWFIYLLQRSWEFHHLFHKFSLSWHNYWLLGTKLVFQDSLTFSKSRFLNLILAVFMWELLLYDSNFMVLALTVSSFISTSNFWAFSVSSTFMLLMVSNLLQMVKLLSLYKIEEDWFTTNLA